LIALLALSLGLILYQEAESSRLQASMISKKAQELSYALVKGPSDRIEFPVHGPFDRRLGYSRLPRLIPRLQQNGFDVSQQVRFSEALLTFTKAGYYPPYAEKSQSGLDIYDNQQSTIYQHRYPRLHYASFKSIPPIIVNALLFIEDRDVLDTEQPLRNPAVDWGRFLKAIASKAGEAVHLDMPAMGGSTLATQIEKYRHSSFGITSSISDKWRQMVSASVRAYRLGENTLTMRHQLVLDYLNSVPLSAAPGYGEVNGLGDGLQVWFNADFDTVNQLLTKDAISPSELAAQGVALRQVLALLIAHRRPSAYLGGNRSELASLVDSHLRILARAGIITESLRDVALRKQLLFRDFRAQPASVPATQNKAVNVIRHRLTGLLGMSLYELDQLDLRVDTSLDYALQQQVTNHLRNLRDVDQARAAGLIGEHLLFALLALQFHFV
jgi:membrane peptidoglycan carboxypeptidase